MIYSCQGSLDNLFFIKVKNTFFVDRFLGQLLPDLHSRRVNLGHISN